MAKIERLLSRLELVLDHIAELEDGRDAVAHTCTPDEAGRMIQQLCGFRGIGVQSTTVLVREAFVRHFPNGKALGSYAALRATPYNGGGIVLAISFRIAYGRHLVLSELRCVCEGTPFTGSGSVARDHRERGRHVLLRKRPSDLLDAQGTRPWEGGPSFSLANRLHRALWIITWRLLASWTPPPLRGWRRFLLRLFGARVAPTANIYGSARIWFPANLEMDEYATIGPGANVYTMATIRLGAHVVISQGAHLCAGTHDVDDPNFQLRARPIEVGERAWIAAEAFVGPGVTVGEGAVLGAHACAMRDLKPWTIYSGNPAQPLRERRVRFGEAVT